MSPPRTTLALLVYVAGGCAAISLAGCAARGAGTSRDRLATRVPAPRGESAIAGRNAGPTGLSRLAHLNTDTPDYTVYAPPAWPSAPQPGDYGPTGVTGGEAVYGSSSSYGSYGYPGSSWGDGPGGWVSGGFREPHDPGHDRTGLAGAIHGASPYRDPGESDGTAHRPGITTGSGPFAHHDDPPAPPTTHDHGSHHGR